MPSQLEILHRSLKSNNYDVPDDYESFRSTLTAKGEEGYKNRKTLYDSLKANNYDVPDDYDTFRDALFSPVKRKQAPATVPQGTPSQGNRTTATPAGRTMSMLPDGWGELSPEAGLPSYMREEAKKRREESYGTDEAAMQQRRRTKQTAKALRGDRQAAKEVGLDKVGQQLRDRMDYTMATGEELRHVGDEAATGSQHTERAGLDLTSIGIAPTVARDEQGNMMMGEDGKPLRGIVSDEVRAGTQQAEQARVRREDLQLQMDEANKELVALDEEAKKISTPDYVYMQDALSPYADPRTSSGDLSAISAARKQIEERISGLQEELNGGRHGFFNGVLKTAMDSGTWLLGLDKVEDNLAMLRVSEKVKRGEELTGAEQSMLDATIANNEVQQRLDDDSDWQYRAGRMTTEMVPFMGQIILTGGYGGVAAVGERMGQKWAAAYARRFGEKALMNRINMNVLRGLGVAMGDVAAGFASANTTGAVNTLNDAMQRRIGQLGYDEQGDYAFTDDEDWLRAIMKAEVSQTKEFATERFGEHLPGLRRLNVALAKQGPRARAVARALSGFAGTKAMRKTADWLRKGGVNGVFGEVLEEEIGLPVDVAIGDMTWEEALSKENQWDIVGGMLLSLGSMHAVGLSTQGVGKAYNTGQYYRYKRAADKADRLASFRMTGEKWEPLKERIDGTTSEDMSGLWDEIRNDNTLYTPEKRAAYDYINALTLMRGYNMGMLFSAREAAREGRLTPGEINPVDDVETSLLNAGEEGRMAETPDEKKQYVDEADAAGMRVRELFGDDDAVDADAVLMAKQDMPSELGTPAEILSGMLEGGFTSEQVAAVADYYQKRARAEGVMDAAIDGVDLQVQQANAEVRSNTHQGTGQVIRVTAGDRSYYVVGGDLNFTSNPTSSPTGEGGDMRIDVETSGQAIVVKDAETGEIEVMSPQQMVLQGVTDAQQLIGYNENEMREQLMQQADDDITFGAPKNEVFELNDEVVLADGEGGTIEAVITGSTPDGALLVESADGVVPMTAEELNRRVVMHNGVDMEGDASATMPQITQNHDQQGDVDTSAVQQAIQGAGDAENGENYAQNEGENIPGEEGAITSHQTGKEADNAGEQPVVDADAMPMIGEGEDAEPDFSRANPERAHRFIYDEAGLSREEADQFIEANKKAADDALEKLQRRQPKIGTSLAKYRKEQAAWQQQVDAAQQQVDYWAGVRSIQLERERAEQEAEFQERQQEAAGRQSLIDEQRDLQSKMATAKRVYGDYFDDDLTTPHDMMELVALNMPRNISWEGRGVVRGLQQELGLKRGVGRNADSNAFNAYLAKKGEGIGVEQAVHNIWESAMNELPSGEKRFDDAEIRNALIDMFMSAEKPSDIRDYVLNSRIAEAEAVRATEDEAMRQAELEAWAEAYHLEPEEREAFEVWMEQRGDEVSSLTDADIQKIYAIFAESIQNAEEYEQNRESGSLDQESVEGRTSSEVGGGEGEVLGQGAPADGGPLAEGREVGPGDEVVSGDDVSGGAQGEPQPIGTGDFGDIYDQFRGKPKEAIDFLTKKKGGEALGALSHKDIGDIDLVWGEEGTGHSDGYGLAKLVKYHPEVLKNLQEILDEMDVVKRTENRINLESNKYKAAVRLTWNEQSKTWLLTLFEKKNSALDNTTDTGKTSDRGKRNDTATPQSTVSEGKGSENSGNLQENQQKNAVQGLDGYDAEEVLNAVRGDIDIRLEEIGTTSSPEEIAEQEAQVNTNPTEAQIEAGNYQKGHIKVDGYDITIENPKGSVRRGTDANGRPWEVTMNNTYGYIRGTEGVDGDHIDVFLSDDPTSGSVFVVDQVKPDGSFDEHKVMYGFADAAEAMQAYLANYSPGWKGLGTISGVSREEFKKWVESSHRKTKPFREYALAKRAAAAVPQRTQSQKEPKRLVSDARMEELKKRLRSKLGGQVNIGVDPEVLAIGAEMAVGYIERGVTKFADYARTMIDEVGDFMRPYLKSFYNAVRDMPEAQEYAGQMDDYQTVSGFDVANFDKTATDVIATAQQIVNEQEAERQTKVAAKKLKKQAPSGQLSLDLFGEAAVAQQQTEAGSGNLDNLTTATPVSQGNVVSLQKESIVDNEASTAERQDAGIRHEQGSERKPQGPGKGVGQEAQRVDDARRGGSTESDRSVQPGLQQLNNVAIPSRQTEPSYSPQNLRNNHAERGKDYAPKGVDARIEANIKAIELMQQLMENGEEATPAQMKVLRQYSGWGGLGKAFKEKVGYGESGYNSRLRDDYQPANPINQRLRELLSPEAYEAANMSRNSAYYTPAAVIDSMWDIARAMGFNGGRVLEGSAGIGNIIGAMPKDMSEHSDIHAVEIDQTTGNILSLLYPDANVDVQGFEQTQVENGSVDLAITNVPFVTGLRVMDTTGDKDLSRRFHDIHDFCIAKNIRKLREGGIGIFISSSGTLDNSAKLREWIVGEGGADVVGAFRLNNETFGGTGATSDIIVVRKRVNGKKSAHAIDVLTATGERTAAYDTGETKKVKGEYVPVLKQLSMDYNKYFVEHPENMGGEMKFGFERGDTYRPTSKALYPVRGKEQREMLEKWVESFADKEWDAAAVQQRTQSQEVYEDLGVDVKEGSMVVSNGELCVAQRGKAVPLGLNATKVKGKTKVECFNEYKAIKDALSDVLVYQTEHEGDEGLKPLLDKLNKAYDGFVKSFGHLHKNTSISFLKNDVDFSGILALETFAERATVDGKRVQEYGKTDVFKGRVVEKEKEPSPQTVRDGVIASIYQFGRIDVPWMTEILTQHTERAMTEQEIRDEIVKSGLGFEDPVSREMVVSYEYLSGNVREKLRQAKNATTTTTSSFPKEGTAKMGGKYEANIRALEKVVPMDIPAHLIDFSIGSSWIDPKLYEDYVKEKTNISVKFTSAGGTWYMETPYHLNDEKNRAMGIVSELLHKTIFGTSLIEAAMQNKTITVSETHKKWDGSTETIIDKEATAACANKIDEIRQDFKEWARGRMQSDDEYARQIERKYNDMFNNYVPKTIPDEFVPEHFGGATHKITLRPHQAKAVIRGTTQPLLLAHEVGTGKTFTLISTAMEMRRLGTARKPMIVVQNATVGQFVESAKELYPHAKVLTLEDKDHTGEGRKNFYAKIKYNDWDMIVVPQSVFERIPDSEERQMAYIQEKIEEKMQVLEQMKDADHEGSSLIVRQAEKEIGKLKDELADLTGVIAEKRNGANGLELPIETAAMLAVHGDGKKEAVTRQNAEVKSMEMLDRQTDDVENFDDMGIDAILVDEAHEYKHLGFVTAMQRGVKGVDPSYSKKAQGVFLKTQAVLEKNNGRNVVFATGTPISNTAAEIWTFMRYLMPADTMKDYGIYYFDDFVRNFGNLQQMLEFTTSGKFKENNRFAGYVNLPELVRIWSGVADTVLTKEAGGVKDKIPEIEGGKAQDIYLPQTKALRSVMKFVKAQLDKYDEMSGKEKKENSHIPLTMYGIAKAAAVDARLVVDDAQDDENSKTNEAVRQTLKSLEETKKYKGTVAIFADNYQNKHSGFNLYEDIRKKLIAAGVPNEQIVVMKSGMSVKKKLEIFDKVNRGEVRVIMGSTFTLGTGVNIQERLHTLIHVDAPNRPMDYTQRNGRILRQGNLHKDMGIPVRVLRFGVEDSLDVTAYQRLKTKGAIADSIMNGKQMMANAMENRMLEEEEDVFGDTVAQLSGSEYAMLKNQAEKDVRKYEAKKKQWEADQTYVHNQIPRLKGQIKTARKMIEENRKYLERIAASHPSAVGSSPQAGEQSQQTKQAITIGKQKFANVEAMGDYLKEFNKKVKATEDAMRENNKNDSQVRRLTINVGGIDFDITTEISVEIFTKGVQMFTGTHRVMTYSCKELGIEDAPVKQSLLREALVDILGNVMTGDDFRERIARSENAIVRDEENLRQVRERNGKPFEYAEELAKAHERYDEYTELMKKELAEKERKYAQMDAEVGVAEEVVAAEDAEEDGGKDEGVRFRSGDATTESQPTGPGRKRTAREERQRVAYAQRQWRRAHEVADEAIRLLGLEDRVKVMDFPIGLTGRKAKAKGWYDTKTGKIVVVMNNHRGPEDVFRTILHEGVAHYGLRQLFGKRFDQFLDDVYENASDEIKAKITAAVPQRTQSQEQQTRARREATEEYLARLAEDTDFERAMEQGWWQKIKSAFLNMLHKLGFGEYAGPALTDNELRYILWRSRENLLDMKRVRDGQRQLRRNVWNPFKAAEDVVMQERLEVGNFEESDNFENAAAVPQRTQSQKPRMSAAEPPGHIARDGEPDVEWQDGRRIMERLAERYNSKELVFIDDNASDDEYLRAIGATEEDLHSFSSEEIQDTALEAKKYFAEKKIIAMYRTDTKKIHIFADRLKPAKAEETFFHENIHGVLHDWYGDGARTIADRFWEIAPEDGKVDKSRIIKNYDAEKQHEELFAYWLASSMVDDSVGDMLIMFDEIDEQRINNLLNTIGYDNSGYRSYRGFGEKGEENQHGEPQISAATENSQADWTQGRNLLNVIGYDRERETTDRKQRRAEDVSEESRRQGLYGLQVQEELDDGLRFRSGDDDFSSARAEYELRTASERFARREAWQDAMASLDVLQQAVARETDAPIQNFENAYLYENRMHGKGKNETEEYDRKYYRPMLEAVHELVTYLNEEGVQDPFGRNGISSNETVDDYLKAKHGLERNQVFAFREAAKDKAKEIVAEKKKQLEADANAGRMTTDEYKKALKTLNEHFGDEVQAILDAFANDLRVKSLKQNYEKGLLTYSELQKGLEPLRREFVKRAEPKKDDGNGNIVSDNYYDEHVQDYGGLSELMDAEEYAQLQAMREQAGDIVDPVERIAAYAQVRAAERSLFERATDEAYQAVDGIETDAALKAQYDSKKLVPIVYARETKTRRDKIAKVWKRINAATKKTLQTSYEGGMLSRDQYNNVRAMFDWYVPLRGWDDNNAEDVYDYVAKRSVFSPSVKKAYGRKSEAASPLATIGNMAVSQIIISNKNLLKQHFLNMALNHRTRLISVSEKWYERIGNIDGEAVWEERVPDIPANASADEIASIIETFNEEMRLKHEAGDAMPSRGRLHLNVHATAAQKSEHVVEVMRNGKVYQLYVNGNPKAAQALNGMRSKSVTRISDTALGKIIEKANRAMAAFFTSKNPAFVVSNLSRDLTMAGASVAIKEGGAYNAQFAKNVVKVLRPRVGRAPTKSQRSVPTGLLPSLMRKWERGELDMGNETERYFSEFMAEGGETGFVNMLSVESFKKKMQQELTRMNGVAFLPGSQGKMKESPIGAGLRKMGEIFEFYNRCAEDATRFIVYMTSRQMGKEVEQAIADAKDVTLNFNRKGTGAKGNAEVRDLFIFVNPAIQALSNMYKMMTGHKLKFAGITALWIVGGALMPIVNQWLLSLFGDDDDEHAYWNLPPWVRKNNFVMWVPGTKNFITIPLAQEFRVFYGFGEMVTTLSSGHHIENPWLEGFSSVMDLVPVNPTGNGGNLLVNFTPTMLQPLVQIGENIDFTGKPLWRENEGNKYAPMYGKAYTSTPEWMVALSEKINDFGGNEGKKGYVEEYAPFWGNYINNPAVWNHLLQGYFGGMYNTIAKGFDVAVTVGSGNIPKVYQTPVLNRFLNRPVERDNAGVLGDEYYGLIKERDQLRYEVNTFKKKAQRGDDGAKEHLEMLIRSDAYKRGQVISHYEKIIGDLKKGLQAADADVDWDDIKLGLDMYKAQLIEELDALKGGGDVLEQARRKYDEAASASEKNRLRFRIEQLVGRDNTLTKPSSARSTEVEKALALVNGDPVESRSDNDRYLNAVSGDDIVKDARIRMARQQCKVHDDEYKRLMEAGKAAEAEQYRAANMKWFDAKTLLDSGTRKMAADKKLLGQGYDSAIVKLLRYDREQMLEAVDGLGIISNY